MSAQVLANVLQIRIPGPNGLGEGATVEWRWGNREVEFSEKAVAAFIEKM